MDNKPLSILFVLPAYLPESYGGGEQQVRKMAPALARAGIRSIILAPTTWDLPARDVQDDIPIVRIRSRHLPSLGGRYMPSFIHWWRHLSRWMAAHRDDYDIVHVIHGRLHAVPAVVIGRRLGKPTIIKNGRGGAHFEFRRMLKRPLYGRLMHHLMLRSTDAYIANSAEIAADLAEFGVAEHAILRIPNGVEIPPHQTPQSEGGAVRCVYAGRLDTEKNIEMMIAGFARLPETPQAELLVVGDGPSLPALELLASRVDTLGRIKFRGSVTDVAAIYAEADVFLSTSESEGMSNAMMEAMSHGVIPVVSDVSGVADLVDDGVNGGLFKPGDEDDFVRKLIQITALPTAERSRLGLAARQRMVDDYSIDAVALRHVEAYRELLAR